MSNTPYKLVKTNLLVLGLSAILATPVFAAGYSFRLPAQGVVSAVQAAPGTPGAPAPGGGKYVSLHLVAADEEISAQWSNVFSNTSATSDTDGAANTSQMSTGGASAAAEACKAMGAQWYVPAKNQLTELWNNRAAIGGFAAGNYFWSSTDAGYPTGAWYMNSTGVFNYNTTNGYGNKNYAFQVRCVRNI